MENSILNQIPFDPAYIIAGLLILVVLLLILTITTMTKVRRLDRQYDYFMRGKDAETLEDVILDQIEEIRDLRAEDRSNKDSIRTLNRNQRASFQKYGLVKYNAFKGMGGNLSFAFAMLDYTNSGFVLNCVHRGRLILFWGMRNRRHWNRLLVILRKIKSITIVKDWKLSGLLFILGKRRKVGA